MPAEKQRSCWLQPSGTPKSQNYLMIHSTHQNIWRELSEAHSLAPGGLKLNTVGRGMVSGWTVWQGTVSGCTVGQGTVSSWTQWGRERSQVEHNGAGNGLKLNTVGQGLVSRLDSWHWFVIMPILLPLPVKLCPDAFISISLPGLPESQWYRCSFLDKTGFALTGILLVKIILETKSAIGQTSWLLCLISSHNNTNNAEETERERGRESVRSRRGREQGVCW